MIGLGANLNSLYRLVVNAFTPSHASFHCSNKIVSTFCNFTSISSCNASLNYALWHFRLGHLSHKRFSEMHTMYPYISCDNKATCDVCYFSKQKKLPFSFSPSNALS